MSRLNLVARRLSEALLVFTLALSPSFASADFSTRLQDLAAGKPIAGQALDARTLIAKLYAGAAAKPLWRPAALQSLQVAIANSEADGLLPRDYFAEPLARKDLSADDRELLATEALIRLAYSLRFGKINPKLFDPNWNYSRALGKDDPLLWLKTTIAQGDIPAALAKIRPQGQYYTGLRKALGDYRAMAAAGGWQALPAGPTLKPEMSDARVPALRQRLQAEHLLSAGGQGEGYDATLVAAVTEFQRRHGLSADGALGAGTVAALNVPVDARIKSLRLNMERLRWVFRDLQPEYVVVNIAGFEAAYIDQGKLRWTGRVIVGKPFRQTPLFKSEISYLEFNPTWTVPPTILRQDLLPKLRVNRGTLKEKNLEVIDGNGQAVDPAHVDWQRFHYALRQKPGPDNALGRVKFMFPNLHSVYLHDTPSRELFGRAERAFSSGCIRVERPLELAAALLKDPAKWHKASIDTVVASNKTQRVNLPRKVPVMLLYLTAFPAPDGSIHFGKDLYTRDLERQRLLDGPFSFSKLDD